MPGARPLSYAQNMEDYHLSLAFNGRSTGTYIDIGGGHPVAGSVSFWFYQRGWNGIVVEPQTRLAELHRRVRPRDDLVQTLVGRENGKSEFFSFDRLHGLSTTVRANAEAAGADYRSTLLDTVSLSELCMRLDGRPIDFLKIDVEGAEAAVIEGGDWTRFRPGIVVVEAVAPLTDTPTWSEWEDQLLGNGYRFALFDTLNRFYVAEERKDLLSSMPSERAPWDLVTHMYEIGRALENEIHPGHQLAKLLNLGFWASLPLLSDETLSAIVAKGLELSGADARTPAFQIDAEDFRGTLALIASAYDGGFLDE